jgi:hypothetical protein
VISRLEKCEQIVDICCNVRQVYISIPTVCDNAARIKECAKCIDNFKCWQSEIGSDGLCSKTATVLLEWTVSESMDVSYIFII